MNRSTPPANTTLLALSHRDVPPDGHTDAAGGVLPRICCNCPVRAETTGGALGATRFGSVGNTVFVMRCPRPSRGGVA